MYPTPLWRLGRKPEPRLDGKSALLFEHGAFFVFAGRSGAVARPEYPIIGVYSNCSPKQPCSIQESFYQQISRHPNRKITSMRSPRSRVLAALVALKLSFFMPASYADEVLRSRLEAINQGFSIQLGDTPLIMLEQLNRFYGVRGYDLIWLTGDGKVRPAVTTLLNAIRNVDDHGLLSEDYHFSAIETRLQDVRENDTHIMALRDLDMLLSDAFLLLATHLELGKTDPQSIDPQWNRVPLHEEWLLQSTAELANPLTPESLSTFLADRVPQEPGYVDLQAARQKLARLVRANEWTAIADGPLLRPGDQDARVPHIRQRLIEWGDLMENADTSTNGKLNDEHYTTELSAAVIAFQNRNGLVADGIIGPRTITALNASPAQLMDRIDVNLERWRWMPTDLGQRYVLVNIAGFELRLVDDGRTSLAKPVVVGRDYRRTPVFSDHIRYLVLNPDWVVPPKLAVQDKLPEIRQDPDYLQRLGYRVYDGWGAVRQLIDPGSVDWAGVSERDFPYRLVQEPGPQNALGQVKFMLPNQYNVYLHDTPARELFQHQERAFSSGCVRVKDAMELAKLLLEPEGWSSQRLDSILKAGRTLTINLKEPVPVHIQYWTAWVDDNGQLQLRKDIYRRDEAIRQALQKPSQP